MKKSLWGNLPPEVEVEASKRLAEAREANQPGLVDVAEGRLYLGWHPVVGRVSALRRAEDAPEHLPRYMAVLDEASHVHAPGDTPEEAVEALVGLFTHTAHQLAEQEEATDEA